jgi:hypothetical protein
MQSDRRRIYIYELSRRVGEILHYMWDPIGIRSVPEARNEYESYVPQVISLLDRGASESEIKEYLTSISTETIGLSATDAAAKIDGDISKVLLDHFRVLKKQYEEN